MPVRILIVPIVFSDHSIFQLKKRHISQKLVIEIVKNPEEVITSFKNRRLRRKLVNGKILQAITITEGAKITVISSYYLRRKI